MSVFSTIVTDVEKDAEVAVGDALKILGNANSTAGKTALTALAGSVEKALTDVAGDTNVTTLTLTLPGTVADFKAVWEAGKTLLGTLGVK